MIATVDLLGPFEVLKAPLTFGPRNTQPDAKNAGPIAWWKINETSGASVADAAGNHFTGRIIGEPHWAKGKEFRNHALELDGTNWVECAESEPLGIRDIMSVSAWFKVRKFERPYETLIAKGEVLRIHRHGSEGKVEFALNGPQTCGRSKGNASSVVSTRAVDDGQWHHLAGVYDGSKMTLYLDGEQDNTIDTTGLVGSSNVPLSLGENAFGRGRLFNGWLDDVRIYRRALTADEIKKLHKQKP